jgi:hypothetical protein
MLSLGTVASNWNTQSEVFIYPESVFPVYETHRAVNYFYVGTHSVPKFHYEEGIRFRVTDEQNPDVNGYFHYSSNNMPYITVYNNHGINEHRTIGTVLHELGHFAHFGQRGEYTGSAYSGFLNVYNLFKESYASYVGWYLGEEYYSTLGWIKSYLEENITGQSRQAWMKTSQITGAYYSPLYVDLIDNYNQADTDSSYNWDSISQVPHAIINEMAAECTNWSSVKLYLDMYCGIYYTVTEYTNFIEPYEFWFSV